MSLLLRLFEGLPEAYKGMGSATQFSVLFLFLGGANAVQWRDTAKAQNDTPDDDEEEDGAEDDDDITLYHASIRAASGMGQGPGRAEPSRRMQLAECRW
jgi:hypothetical protein